MATTSKTMFNESGESGHLCLVPDLSGNAFSFSPLSMMFAVGLSYMAFIMLRFLTHQSDDLDFFFFNLFSYLFLGVLGLRFCARAFSISGEQDPLFIAVCGPLTVVASPIA